MALDLVLHCKKRPGLAGVQSRKFSATGSARPDRSILWNDRTDGLCLTFRELARSGGGQSLAGSGVAPFESNSVSS
jgi:hypothetical protein